MDSPLSRSHDGLSCGAVFYTWQDMVHRIIGDGEDGLLFQFLCPLCTAVLRTDVFAYPPDAPQRREPDRPGG